MAPTPRRTLESEFIAGMDCPICGASALELHSMERYPDYVDCGSCQSQFVAEDGGDRVMYGNIPNTYPKTRRFALQQWVWPEAIQRRASEERPDAPPPPPAAPVAVPPAPPEPDPEEEVEEPVLDELDEPVEDMAAAMPTADLQAYETESPEFGSEMGAEAAPDLPDWGAGEWEPEAVEADDLAEAGLAQEVQVAGEAAESPTEPMPVDDLTDDEAMAEAVDPADDVFGAAEPASGLDEGETAADPMQEFSEAGPMAAGLTPHPESDATGDWPDLTQADRFDESTESSMDMDDSASEADEGDDLLDVFGAAAAAAPPFAASDETHESTLPGDLEPAPPMPSWLGAESQADDSEMPAPADESMEPAPDEAEMLERLWQSTESELDNEPTPAGSSLSDAELSTWDDDELDSLEAMTDSTTQAATETPAAEMSEADVARMQWGGEALMRQPEPAEAEVEPEPDEAREPQEPAPGERFRVVLRTSQAKMPEKLCAHCGRTPVAGKLSIAATVYRGAGLGERKMASFQVPVCSDCQSRAQARSEEQQTARLQAHLVSVLVAMIMVVGALAFRLVDFQGNLLLDLIILALMAGMGYAIPAVFLLIRASSYPQPADAEFVQSTLRIPADTEGAETAFEWRNRAYADRFLAANDDLSVSGVNKITERSYESA